MRPDLTCLGKIIGGGLPVGAYGGSRDVMSEVAPLGGVYQAGTLSGNPLAVAAGLAAIRALPIAAPTSGWKRWAPDSSRGLREGARKAGVPLTVNRVGSMLTGVLLRRARSTDYASARRVGHRALRAVLPRRCSSAASTWRPRSSRRRSSRWRTPRPTSMRPGAPPRRRSPPVA